MADAALLQAALPPLSSLQTGPSALVPRPAAGGDRAALEASVRAQANEFEATFIASLLQPVFEGLARDRTFGGGFAEETWSGLLTQEYAKGIAGNSNLGVADQVYKQLIKTHDAAAAAGATGTAAPKAE